MDARRAHYTHRAAKAKEACAPSLTLAVVLYPLVLGFLFAARMGSFDLLIPTPTIPNSPPSPNGELRGSFDLWDTYEVRAITRTAFAFATVSSLHLFITFHLVLRGVPGSGYIKSKLAWIFPVIFWLATTTFFITYVSMARYHTHIGEWIVASAFSIVILGVTVGFLLAKCRPGDVLEEEQDPEIAEAEVAGAQQ